MQLLRILFILLGTLSLVLGIIGIFIPGIPTTPFLLLTAGLYLRSSDKLFQKVVSNPYLGKYILNFQEKKGMSLRSKIYSIILMWIMIFCSCYFFIPLLLTRIILIAIGLIGTAIMGFVIRTVK